jgi:hypothetical protein
MGKWTYEVKKENNTSHLFLAALGLLGVGVLLVAFALNVSSAPSGYNNPVKLGHSPGDIEGGTFFQDASAPADPNKNTWRFPGVMAILNTAPVNAVALTISQMANVAGMYAIHATSAIAQVARFESASPGGAQIALVGTEAGGKEFRVGTGINNPGDFIIHNQTDGIDPFVISGNLIGINDNTPGQALDVTGQVHATGDICTDADGGKCLSNLHKNVAVYNGMVQKCNPATCGAGALSVNPVDAKCDNGFVLVACGGGVSASGANNVKISVVTPLYASLGGGLTDGSGNPVDGCRLSWGVSAGSATGGAIAICAPKGT